MDEHFLTETRQLFMKYKIFPSAIKAGREDFSIELGREVF